MNLSKLCFFLFLFFLAAPLEAKKINADMTEAVALLKKGKPQLALEIFQQLQELRPHSSEVQFHLGLTYQALGEAKKAAWHFEKTVQLENGHDLAWEELGKTYEAMGMFRETRRVYLKRLEKYDHNVDLWVKYSRYLRQHRQYQDAEEAIWKALSFVPQDLKLSQEYAVLLETMNAGPFVIAKQWANVLEIDPNSAMARYHLAQAQEHGKNFEDAKKNYLVLVKNNPEFPEAHLRLALIYAQENALSQAYQHLEEFRQRSPQSSLAYEEKVKLLLRENKKSEALSTFEEWAKNFRKDENVYLAWGDFVLAAKDQARAIDIYLQGLGQIPDSLHLLDRVGQEYFLNKDWAKAKSYNTTLLERDPHHERALARLSTCAMEMNLLTEAHAYLTLLRKILEDRQEIRSIAVPMRLPAHQ